MRKDLKIVILTRDFPGSAYLVNGVNKRKNVSAIVLEEDVQSQSASGRRNIIKKIVRNPKYNIQSSIIKILSRIDFNEKRLYENMLYKGEKGSFDRSIPLYRVEDINSFESLRILKKLKPDLLIVSGTRIIKKPVIDIPSIAIINIHMGIVPDYRGVWGEFFALYNKDFDNIGYTIHCVNERLDAGDIILQERIKLEPRDNHITLRIKNYKRGVDGFIKVIEQFEQGEVSSVPQKERGRLYTSKDLDQGKYLKVLIECMIRKYITRRV